MQTAEQDYLEQRKLARGDQDSVIEQPENTEAVDVSQDAPVEEVTESEVITNDEATTELPIISVGFDGISVDMQRRRPSFLGGAVHRPLYGRCQIHFGFGRLL